VAASAFPIECAVKVGTPTDLTHAMLQYGKQAVKHEVMLQYGMLQPVMQYGKLA
jgi:hypothetical protein